jgi:uncharacterized protein (TIGR02001 family)
MRFTNKFTPVVLASSLAVAGFITPALASAEVSASAGVASFYLWRGLDVSGGGAQVSGSLDYSHESGAYAGIWTSSVWAGLGIETDLYAGYAGEAGPVSYDLSFWSYQYPEGNVLLPPGDLSDSDLSEFVISLGVADFGLGIYFGNDTGGADDYTYTTLDYSFSDFNVLYGFWTFDTITGSDEAHLTFSYAVNDNVTFTVTKGIQDGVSTSIYDEDPLVHISYSLPVEM